MHCLLNRGGYFTPKMGYFSHETDRWINIGKLVKNLCSTAAIADDAENIY